jgi:hypothetical protein
MLRIYRDIQPGELLAFGGDCSAGCGDFSAGHVISKTHMDVPIVFHSPVISSEMTNVVVPMFEQLFDITGNRPLVCYERNNGGFFEMDRMATLNRLSKFEIYKQESIGQTDKPTPNKFGLDMTGSLRSPLLSNLKDHIDNNLLKIYDKMTIIELMSFVKVQHSNFQKAEAEKGAHDDLVMSLAIAAYMLQFLKLKIIYDGGCVKVDERRALSSGKRWGY